MSTVYLELKGAPVPLSKLAWVKHEPCGCVGAIVVAECFGKVLAASEEQAWEQLSGPNKESIRRDQTEGCRVAVGTLAEMSAQLVIKCPHTPQWGLVDRIIPEGHEWREVARRLGQRRSSRRHLVMADTLQHADATALCGSAGWWETRTWSDSNVPTCVRCRREAAKRVTA